MKKAVSAVAGLLSVVVLLVLLVLHVVHPDIQAAWWVVAVLLTLIGGLLGVDLSAEQLPGVEIQFTESDGGDNND